MENVVTVMPKIQVDYSDSKSSFKGSVHYEVQTAPKPIVEDLPIVCTVHFESSKVIADIAPVVTAAIALLNPIMSQPYKPNFKMKGDALLLFLTDRQTLIITAALNLVYVESQNPDFTGFTADATLEELGALLTEIKHAQMAQL